MLLLGALLLALSLCGLQLQCWRRLQHCSQNVGIWCEKFGWNWRSQKISQPRESLKEYKAECWSGYWANPLFVGCCSRSHTEHFNICWSLALTVNSSSVRVKASSVIQLYTKTYHSTRPKMITSLLQTVKIIAVQWQIWSVLARSCSEIYFNGGLYISLHIDLETFPPV